MSTEPTRRPLQTPVPKQRPQAIGPPNDAEILDQIVEEFTQRLRDGEFPAIHEYQEKYPRLKHEIDDVLTSVALIEKLKGETESRPSRKSLFKQLAELEKIGDYQIVREVGRGGMGVVFEAIHESLGRRVAIKVMPTPMVNGDKFVERFQQESKAAAKLHHTNIVSVFGVGEQQGLHYYVMDFVDGRSLDHVISGLKMGPTDSTRIAQSTRKMGGLARSETNVSEDSPRTANTPPNIGPETFDDSSARSFRRSHAQRRFRWAARLGANIADGLAYAHQAKILHRDVKPSNIILDRKGNVWITDFGLAKDVTEKINLTKTGDVIGTPQYLAPESLEGKYDQRSEIYCLGLTLYELVTLRPAYEAGSPAEILRAVATSKPPAPKKIAPNLPRDLSTIIEKAIARDPGNRYQHIGEFRDDLLAFVEDRSISARPLGSMEKLFRWSRRNPLVAGLSTVSLCLLILVAISASIGYLTTMAALANEKREKQAAEIARQLAEENFNLMKIQFDRAEANVALTMEAFDQMFKQVIARGSATQDDLNIEGFREVSGIETTITREDAEFLEQMLKFYEAFNELNGDNQELIAESAKAFRRVGNIYRLIGEMESAAGAYEKSVLRYQLMLDEHPESRDHLLNLVRTQNELSVACRKNGRSLKAHDWNLQSQELLENSRYSSSDPEVRLELARTLTAMGFNLSRISTMDIVAAKRGVRAKPGTRSGASHATRDRVPFQPFKAQPYWRDFFRFGRAEMNRRNRQLIERAIRILDDLIREEPGNAEYLSVRATCYSVLAATRIAANRSSGLEMRDRAIAAFESLVEENPDNPEYRYLLALACTIGTTPPQREDGDLIRQALAITEALTDQFPTMLDYHHLHASLRIKVAGSLARQNQIDEAKSCLDDAASSVGVLLDLTPSDRSFLGTVRMLLEGYQRLGKLYEDAGMRQQANEVAQRGRQLRNQLRSQVWPMLQ